MSAAPQNMATPNSDKMVDMSFKVPAVIRERANVKAFQRSMSMKDLIEAAKTALLHRNQLGRA